MIGKRYMITGMGVEIVSDQGEKWEARNVTIRETVFIDKAVHENAIKLGKAEEKFDKKDI